MSDGISDMMIESENQRNVLKAAMNIFGAKYRVKYVDSENFTVPVSLNEDRIDKLVQDFSIEKIELILDM